MKKFIRFLYDPRSGSGSRSWDKAFSWPATHTDVANTDILKTYHDSIISKTCDNLQSFKNSMCTITEPLVDNISQKLAQSATVTKDMLLTWNAMTYKEKESLIQEASIYYVRSSQTLNSDMLIFDIKQALESKSSIKLAIREREIQDSPEYQEKREEWRKLTVESAILLAIDTKDTGTQYEILHGKEFTLDWRKYRFSSEQKGLSIESIKEASNGTAVDGAMITYDTNTLYLTGWFQRALGLWNSLGGWPDMHKVKEWISWNELLESIADKLQGKSPKPHSIKGYGGWAG